MLQFFELQKEGVYLGLDTTRNYATVFTQVICSVVKSTGAIWYHTVRTQNGLSPCGFMQILLAERFKGFCADIVNHRKQSPLQIADRVMTSEYVR